MGVSPLVLSFHLSFLSSVYLWSHHYTTMALGMLTAWTSRRASKSAEALIAEPARISEEAKGTQGAGNASDGTGESPPDPAPDTDPANASTKLKPETQVNPLERPPSRLQRFSFHSITAFNGSKTHITKDEEVKERTKAHDAAKRSALLYFPSAARSADKAAEKNALAMQRLIIGTSSITPSGSKAPPISHTQLTRIKSELMQPKSANRLIAKLRDLPVLDVPADEQKSSDKTSTPKARGPIHAVCLEDTDDSVKEKHFSKLDAASVASASLATLTSLIGELHIVNLITAPDFGLGQPGDGPGILAGAVPTAETVISGIEKITPQLMALGYASDRAIMPDHTGIHPPTDRMSVLTYWWGFELCLPPPSLKHLQSVPNVSHEVVNFLTVLSTVNDGVREILPFVRYISQFVDFEFNSIKAQNKGKGVICAATWIMPAAMVPRPWDFSDPPKSVPAKDNVPNAPAPAKAKESATPVPPSNSENPNAADDVRSGKGVVEDIIPSAGAFIPAVLITPPSVIKSPKEIKVN